jgi:hypothetical protein
MKFTDYITELKIASFINTDIKFYKVKSYTELKDTLNSIKDNLNEIFYFIEFNGGDHKEFYFIFEDRIYNLIFSLENNKWDIAFSTEDQKYDEEINHKNIKRFFSIIASIIKLYFKKGTEFIFSGTKRSKENSNTTTTRNKMYKRILKNLRLNPEEKNNTITFTI